jgi:hypothetical protein
MQLKHAFEGIQRERDPQTPSFWEDRREEAQCGVEMSANKKKRTSSLNNPWF